MKRSMSILRVFVLLVMFAGLLAACGNTNNTGSTAAGNPPAAETPAPADGAAATEAPAAAETTGATETAAAETPAEPAAAEATTVAPAAGSGDPVSLEILYNAGGQTLPEGEANFVKQMLDQDLGTDINLILYSSGDDYNSQLNVRLAAGNYPDMFGVNRTTMADFAQKGQLLDMTPYLDQLGPAITQIGEDALKTGQIDGKQFGIPKNAAISQFSYWIRQDWLDKLGLKAPTNLDELMTVATAFREQDPDGNGQKDTWGLTGGQFGAFSPIFGAFGVGMPGSFYVEDGKIVNAYFDPGMKDALAYIQKMVAADVVDPEWAANTANQHNEKAIQGRFGMIYTNWPSLVKTEPLEQIKTVNPNAEWVQFAPPTGPGGQADGVYDIGTTGGMWAVSRAVKDQPEKLQKIIDLLNYVSQGKGSLLVQYGQEGRHFNLEGEKVVPTELMGKEANFTWVYQFTGRPEESYLKTKFAPQEEYIDFAANLPRIKSLNGFIIPPAGYNPVDADRFTEEQMVNFINGTRPLSEYDAFLEELNTTYNYQAYLDAAQEQLTALGFGQ